MHWEEVSELWLVAVAAEGRSSAIIRAATRCSGPTRSYHQRPEGGTREGVVARRAVGLRCKGEGATATRRGDGKEGRGGSHPSPLVCAGQPVPIGTYVQLTTGSCRLMTQPVVRSSRV